MLIMDVDLVSWCRKELSKTLHTDVEDSLLDYLMSMATEKDIREYLQDLMSGVDTTQINAFMNEFFRHWCPPQPHLLETTPLSGEAGGLLFKQSREDLVLYDHREVIEPITLTGEHVCAIGDVVAIGSAANTRCPAST